jgi:hypothetical protein
MQGRFVTKGVANPYYKSRIQSTDVVLPLAEDPSRMLRIRCVVRPDDAQALLFDRLGLSLPERFRSTPANLRNVAPTFGQKCPIFLDLTPRTAEVGLAEASFTNRPSLNSTPRF